MFFFARKRVFQYMRDEKAKILIIEDDKFLLKLYSDKLRRAGFLILEATTGEEGMNKILSEDPDLIILDLVLPGKNGFEVLSELKLSRATKNIPVIILSNLGQESDIERGMKLGAEDYVVKTEFSTNQLPEYIKEKLVSSKK